MKFYPSDWRADPALRMCSMAARGLWAEMMCIMHEAEPYGYLLVNGQPVNEKQLASLAGAGLRETVNALADLESCGVFSRDSGVIYSRRMKRDREKAERDKANGKGGGNPRLKAGVNPPDKAQIPDTRKKDAGPSGPPSDEAELFERGKEVLGKTSGGLIAQLLKSKKQVPLARAAIEMAATKENPREYIGRILSGPAPPGKVLSPFGTEYPDGII